MRVSSSIELKAALAGARAAANGSPAVRRHLREVVACVARAQFDADCRALCDACGGRTDDMARAVEWKPDYLNERRVVIGAWIHRTKDGKHYTRCGADVLRKRGRPVRVNAGDQLVASDPGPKRGVGR